MQDASQIRSHQVFKSRLGVGTRTANSPRKSGTAPCAISASANAALPRATPIDAMAFSGVGPRTTARRARRCSPIAIEERSASHAMRHLIFDEIGRAVEYMGA